MPRYIVFPIPILSFSDSSILIFQTLLASLKNIPLYFVFFHLSLLLLLFVSFTFCPESFFLFLHVFVLSLWKCYCVRVWSQYLVGYNVGCRMHGLVFLWAASCLSLCRRCGRDFLSCSIVESVLTSNQHKSHLILCEKLTLPTQTIKKSHNLDYSFKSCFLLICVNL